MYKLRTIAYILEQETAGKNLYFGRAAKHLLGYVGYKDNFYTASDNMTLLNKEELHFLISLLFKINAIVSTKDKIITNDMIYSMPHSLVNNMVLKAIKPGSFQYSSVFWSYPKLV